MSLNSVSSLRREAPSKNGEIEMTENSMILHTNPRLVYGSVITERPTYGDTASGYGSKIATRYMLNYGGRMYRVYVMCYGNSGAAYIRKYGRDLFLDL